MKGFVIGIIVILSAVFPISASETRLSDSSELLEQLDSELTRRNDYTSKRQNKADSVKVLLLADSLGPVSRYLELGDLQGGLNADSAIVMFSQGFKAAMSVGDSVMAQRFLIKRATELCKLSSTRRDE